MVLKIMITSEYYPTDMKSFEPQPPRWKKVPEANLKRKDPNERLQRGTSQLAVMREVWDKSYLYQE